jgi:hypothetical protein
MQYMLMCCFDETQWAQLPDTQKDTIMQEYSEFIQAIVKSGHLRTSTKLQPSSMATTLREKSGVYHHRWTVRGEQRAARWLPPGRVWGLDEAIAIARRIPTLRVGGSIEVRLVVPASQW